MSEAHHRSHGLGCQPTRQFRCHAFGVEIRKDYCVVPLDEEVGDLVVKIAHYVCVARPHFVESSLHAPFLLARRLGDGARQRVHVNQMPHHPRRVHVTDFVAFALRRPRCSKCSDPGVDGTHAFPLVISNSVCIDLSWDVEDPAAQCIHRESAILSDGGKWFARRRFDWIL